jgi:ATP-binding cassette subfamily B protein
MTAPAQTARQSLPTWKYLKRMWTYAPGTCLAHGLLWDLMNLSSLIPGLLIARSLDRLSDGSLDWHSTEVILMAVYAIAVSVGWLVAGFTEIRMRFLMSGFLRLNLLRHLLERPGASPLPYPLGETISRFRDDAYSAEDVIDWTDEIIIHSLIGIGALVALASIDLTITVAVTIPLIAIVAISQWASSRITRYREASSQATSELTGAVGSILAATQDIRLAGAEHRAIERIAALNNRRRSTMTADAVASRVIEAIAGSISGIATGIVMLIAANQLRDGSLSIGDFALFLLWIGFVSSLTVNLGTYLAFYRQASVAFRRMDAMLGDAPPEALVEHASLQLRGPLPELEAPVRNANDRLEHLEISGLSYRHPRRESELRNEHPAAIEEIDLRIERGTLTVVTGKIGSGKTTLLQAVLGLLPAQAGEIRWNGNSIDDLSAWMVPPRVAYTPQSPSLFSDTLRQNLLLGYPDGVEGLSDAIRGAVLEDDIATFPLGLETQIGTRGVRLSGGQVQRTAAARMLVRQPELLVIDDLSSALDVETEKLLWERLFASGDLTCLAVSHRRAALQRADLVLFMQDGKIVARGSLEELIANNAEMRELWSSADAPDELELA